MSNFSKDLEKQIRQEVKDILKTLPPLEGWEHFYPCGGCGYNGNDLKKIEDKLVKLALDCY